MEADKRHGDKQGGQSLSYSRQWARLDNAAKIFPPTTSVRDAKVFRFVCELYEPVDSEILRHALDKTVKRFPHYRCVIKKGLFWYYFEQSPLMPVVREEYKPPCSTIYDVDKKKLLFEVTYYKCRINLEVFHALSDGAGAMQFLQTLVLYYFAEKYAEEIDPEVGASIHNASESQKNTDSFSKYYKKSNHHGNNRAKIGPAAYQHKGEILPEFRVGVIEGIASAEEIRTLAAEHGATLTEFMTAVFIKAIHEGMSYSEERKPVVISIPVNLRRFFPSESARNFFGLISVSHQFRSGGDSFEDIMKSVQTCYREQLKKEKLAEKVNSLIGIEQNFAAKIVPLALKNPGMRFAHWLRARTFTATLSNIGRVTIPEQFEKHVRLFDLLNRTRKMQLCLCTYQDKLMITFTAPFINTDVQRCFFRELTGHGIKMEVTTNRYEV